MSMDCLYESLLKNWQVFCPRHFAILKCSFKTTLFSRFLTIKTSQFLIMTHIQYINLLDKSWITRHHTWYHRLSRKNYETCRFGNKKVRRYGKIIFILKKYWGRFCKKWGRFGKHNKHISMITWQDRS